MLQHSLEEAVIFLSLLTDMAEGLQKGNLDYDPPSSGIASYVGTVGTVT